LLKILPTLKALFGSLAISTHKIKQFHPIGRKILRFDIGRCLSGKIEYTQQGGQPVQNPDMQMPFYCLSGNQVKNTRSMKEKFF
jgi:hypothetical protein